MLDHIQLYTIALQAKDFDDMKKAVAKELIRQIEAAHAHSKLALIGAEPTQHTYTDQLEEHLFHLREILSTLHS